jgi:hypothetical protein
VAIAQHILLVALGARQSVDDFGNTTRRQSAILGLRDLSQRGRGTIRAAAQS